MRDGRKVHDMVPLPGRVLSIEETLDNAQLSRADGRLG